MPFPPLPQTWTLGGFVAIQQLTGIMATASPPRHFKRPLHRRTPSSLEIVQEEIPSMATPEDAQGSGVPKSRSEPQLGVSELSARPTPGDSTHAGSALLDEPVSSTNQQPLSTPGLSRSASFSNSSYHDESDFEDAAFFPPVEKLTMFDFVENLALSQRIEKIQSSIASQTERIKNQAKNRGITKDRVVEEWRRRVPTEAEQLEKYKRRMRHSVDRLNRRWNESLTVTAREKASFIAAVMNIFVSGYLIGCHPDLLPHWYTAQLLYFMPLRFFTYHKKGYHYFLADLCYFVNILLVLSIWAFPQSKRLFIATYCLCMGNNAVAIVMWRNSLVFHSMDKVVRLVPWSCNTQLMLTSPVSSSTSCLASRYTALFTCCRRNISKNTIQPSMKSAILTQHRPTITVCPR